MRRGILGIVGAKVVSAERTPCTKRPIAIHPRIDHLNRSLQNRRIQSVDRLGKRVVIRLDSQDRLVFEPRMTGLVLVSDPPTPEHLRFRLRLSGKRISEVLYWDRRGLGKIGLLSDAAYQAKLESGSLGPDALDISFEQFRSRYRPSRREVKVALLDQSTVAGIGNLYASEILHRAGVDPRARCNRLVESQWREIFDCMIEVLEEAIRKEGSTLSDGTYRNALNQSGSYQNHHRVYDRAGEWCPSCESGRIIRIVQAQRSTFFCRNCQRKSVRRGFKKAKPTTG